MTRPSPSLQLASAVAASFLLAVGVGWTLLVWHGTRPHAGTVTEQQYREDMRLLHLELRELRNDVKTILRRTTP